MDNFLQIADLADLRSLVSNTLSLKGVIKVGSMFSGWGVLEMVLRMLQRKWNDTNLDNPMQAFCLFCLYVASIFQFVSLASPGVFWPRSRQTCCLLSGGGVLHV